MIKESIYKLLPHVGQNLLITLFDFLQYRKRHGKEYHQFKEVLKANDFLDTKELEEIQNSYLINFLEFARDHSTFFKKTLSNLDLSKGLSVIKDIPICNKEEFRANIADICTGNPSQMYAAKTGGTTGKSMEVYFRYDDFQKRFAILDNFRERFGYKFGKKTAWLSGKDILTKRDMKRNRYWKLDWLYNIKYYSTFNINESTIPAYIADLKKFQPLFIVGFPSSIVEIARYGLRNNIDLGYKVRAIFPTAESKMKEEAEDMIAFFGGGVYDQYASSEGACFITECESGNLHFEPISGIIEVVDDNNLPSEEGRMLITAFHTRGTPLIRYDIGDRMKWSDKTSCSCGRKTRLVDHIQGRLNDYIYSAEKGKCNLGNISNCIKYVNGVKRFQIIQNQTDSINVLIERAEEYTSKDEEMFNQELIYRLGDKIHISFEYVDEIPREKSGKFRIVKNSIKHLVQD